jgi:nitrogen fixation protein FixH
MKSHWGKGVVGAFILFVVIILGVVVFAMTREVDLVMDHPYERGLEYDGRIRAMERTAALANRVDITSTPEDIIVRFPDPLPRSLSGTITLYRPANRHRDFTIPVNPDSASRQRIAVRGLDRGLWRVRVAWTLKDREFYSEQPVMLR